MDPLDSLYENMAVAETGDARVPIVAAHRDGDVIAPLIDPASGAVQGGVFISEEGGSFYVELGNDGLPIKAYANGFTILFENFRSALVDVAFIAPDGEIEIVRDVAFDANLLDGPPGRASSMARAQASAEAFGSWSEALETIGAGISIASCAVAATAAVGTSGAAIPIAGVICTSAVVKTAALFLPEDETGLRASSAGFGALVSGSLCVAGELVECVVAALDVATGVVILAEDAFEDDEEEVASVTGALRFGGVWEYRDTPNSLFLVINEENAYDTGFDDFSGCWWATVGTLVGVDGDTFTYGFGEDDDDISVRFVLLQEDVLEITRLEDSRVFVLDRVPLTEDVFTPRCGTGPLAPDHTPHTMSSLLSQRPLGL
ncbi:MAG: hypothetical protein AAFN13_00460 [Bacteroidota bacterium]